MKENAKLKGEEEGEKMSAPKVHVQKYHYQDEA
jgi:hypothetical protein